MSDKKIKIVFSILKSAAITVIFIVGITLAADLASSLKDWLKNTFSHHWVGKSILSLAVFVVFSVVAYLCPCQKDTEKMKKSLKNLLWISITGLIVIFLFFVWEALLK